MVRKNLKSTLFNLQNVTNSYQSYRQYTISSTYVCRKAIMSPIEDLKKKKNTVIQNFYV